MLQRYQSDTALVCRRAPYRQSAWSGFRYNRGWPGQETVGTGTARPGSSNHELGLAIDFECDGTLIRSRTTTCFEWLAASAPTFGLYNLPSEPWHWSVDGTDAASSRGVVGVTAWTYHQPFERPGEKHMSRDIAGSVAVYPLARCTGGIGDSATTMTGARPYSAARNCLRSIAPEVEAA